MLNLIETYSSVFVQNKYFKWYEDLIQKSIIRKTEAGTYYEKHHYVPKSILPNNNTVKLTAREHYIAHLLLAKCVNNIYRKKMVYAVTSMKFKIIPKIKCNSKLYQKFQKEANTHRSIYMKQRVVSEETREKLSKFNKGRKLSSETIEKLKEWHKNNPRVLTETQRKAISLRNTGRVVSSETRKKQSINRKNRIKLECPFCKKSCEVGNFTRWHGDNCSHPSNTSNTELRINTSCFLQHKYCEHCNKEYNLGTYGRYHGDKCKLKVKHDASN